MRGGEISAREVVGAALRAHRGARRRASTRSSRSTRERALAAADAIEPGDERPFAGVPIAIKANVPVAGLCMNFGSKFLAGHRPGHSAYLVRRLRDAGFVIVGITNMPEFGILPTTEPRHTGADAQPVGPRRARPGGSSGGSAAAVAAGMLPVAHGNDGGGSIRIPAACCGLVGPQAEPRARLARARPRRLVPGLRRRAHAHGGRDRASCSTCSPATRSATRPGRRARPSRTRPSVRRDPGRLRVAMTADNALGVDVDPECVRGMHEAAELLARSATRSSEAAPALPGGDALALFIQAFGPAVALGIAYGELLAGRPPEEDEIEPLSRAIYDLAQNLASVGYLGAVAQLQALARGVVAFFAEYDLLLTPALAERPLAIGDCNGLGEDPLADLARSGRFTPFTALFNVTGQPAISVPVGFGDDGLPTAVQLVGKPLGEDTLLQVAAQMEAALGRPAHIPDL